MIKFPSIEQYRQLIHQVKANYRYAGKDTSGEPIYDVSRSLPTLTFRGTAKLHGTNAAISFNTDSDEISYQSRSRVLSLGDDNAGFYAAMKPLEDDIITDFIVCIQELLPERPHTITIFGEWCGQGIQKGVAVAELPKMFVYFAIRIQYDDTSEWLDIRDVDFDQGNIHNILDFGIEYIDIDFNYPERSQNDLIKLTEAVEAECPVGFAFGVSGTGEGIVWTCVTPGWESSKYWMKVKGEKHSASKVKTLAPVDIEALETAQKFAEYAVTEARLQQGLDYLRDNNLPLDVTSTGLFIRWVYNDVLKEESDTLAANGITNVGKVISQKARPWFLGNIHD